VVVVVEEAGWSLAQPTKSMSAAPTAAKDKIDFFMMFQVQSRDARLSSQTHITLIRPGY
jgi:hypothetical protein